MLKLRILQPGQEAAVYEFAGDEAVLGRAPGCDLQLSESYVSKRHAKVLAGLVLVDLGSSNGTHVDGRRIDEPVILTGRTFKLGTEVTDLLVEVEHVADRAGDEGQILRVRQDLDAERRRNAALVREMEELRSSSGRDLPDPAASPVVQELRRELQDARRRLESLKGEVEDRDVSASEGIQVRLAQDALSDVQRTNEELRRQLAELQGKAAGPAVEAARRALASRVAELEAECAELHAKAGGLEADLKAAKAAAQPVANVSDLFFKLQAENRDLRQRLEQSKSGAAEGSPALFFELQAVNSQLRKRVQELEAGAPAPDSARTPDDAELVALRKENHDLRMSKADLLGELEQLRQKVLSAGSTPARSRSVAGHDQGTALLQTLVDDDVEGHPPLVEGAPEPFLVLELFRFLRQIERLVTRMAGEFIQLYDQRTILPDVAGNLRRLIGAVIGSPQDARPRHDLIAYFDELRKWLVVALGANRRAAERFVEELRSDLSERGLTADRPMPAIKKLTGSVDSELWSRASSYLKKLTADVVEERLQQLSRQCAEELRREQDRA